MPSSLCGVVGLKPTAGLVGRSGTIPISFTRDVMGPIARTVTDVASLLNGMVGVDPLDPLTADSDGHIPSDYRRFLHKDGLRGARIGVWRREDLWQDDTVARRMESVLDVFRKGVRRSSIPCSSRTGKRPRAITSSVMFTEFEHGINRYLSGLTNTEIRSLADVVAFNEAHSDRGVAWHNQALLEGSVGSAPLPNPAYRIDLPLSRAHRAG